MSGSQSSRRLAGDAEPLLLFYEEPDPDRWFPWDRYPRRAIRRLLRGKPAPGGQKLVFLNLCAGLDRLGVSYVVNNYTRAARNPDQPVGIIGKPHVLDLRVWRNPIMFGASIMSHPLADPTLHIRRPIARILVPGPWMCEMCRPYWGAIVRSWPVGIDTDAWAPSPGTRRDVDVLLYDKVRWQHEQFDRELLEPMRQTLARRGLRTATVRYGHYKQADFHALLQRSRSMIFVCEHETQGLAYQQALACDVPVLAWDRAGYWQDPEYFPDRVKFEPVTSVPYWDDRCGDRFAGPGDFDAALERFWAAVLRGSFRPRAYVLENLTLAHCAKLYLAHWDEAFGDGRRVSGSTAASPT